MTKVLYRAILHGPMTWKTSHIVNESSSITPYLVIFEPASSLVILSQGTLLIPQISVFLNKLKSQILSVFVFNDSTAAKELVSELYSCLDRNMSIFDVYKNEKTLKLVMKSVSSFHLPLEIVLKKVEYITGTKVSSRNYNNDPITTLRNGLNRLHMLNPQDYKATSIMGREHTTHSNHKYANTVTNNPLSYNYDFNSRIYNEEPKSVKNSSDTMDTYNLRVGLEEGFHTLTTSTDLMQKVFQALDRKGPKVNKLSLNFYKINKGVGANQVAQRTGTILSLKKTLPVPYNRFNTQTHATTPQHLPTARLADAKLGLANSKSGEFILPKPEPTNTPNPGLRTPEFVNTPLLRDEYYKHQNFKKSALSNDPQCETVAPTLSNILRSLTAAIDKNTEAINLSGSVNNANNYSSSSNTNLSNRAKADSSEAKFDDFSGIKHGLASMSTHEFFGYSSPTSNCNSNNANTLNRKNYSLLSEESSHSDYVEFEPSNNYTDVKLDDLQVKPVSTIPETSPIQPHDVHDEKVESIPEEKLTDSTNYDNFVQNYIQVLEKLSEVEKMYDLTDIKQKFDESNHVHSQTHKNENVVVNCSAPVEDEPSPASKLSEPSDTSFSDSDDLSDFSDESAVANGDLAIDKEKVAKDNVSSSIADKSTILVDEDYKDDLESTRSGHVSAKSDYNVILDEFNQLSSKNDLLAKDLSNYRSKVDKLKDKIKNIKSLHKFEMEELINNNYINEEKLRSKINDVNVTMKMMEQERVKLTDMLEQHKMTIKRLNREKVESLQHFSRLEDDYNKLQMAREMDKNEKSALNKLKLEVEQLRSDNDVLNNKLRAANEKLLKLQHDDKLMNDTVTDLKDKLDRFESDKLKSIQIINENKLLKTKEFQLRDRLEVLKKQYSTIRNEFNLEKASNTKLTNLNNELKDDLKRAKMLLSDYESKEDKFESKMSMLESNNTVLLKNLESIKIELADTKKIVDASNKDNAKLESKYQHMQSSVEKLESINHSLSAEIKELHKVLDYKDKENAKLVSLIADKDNEFKHFKNDTKTVVENYNKLVTEHSYLRASYDSIESSYVQIQKYEKGLKDQLQSMSQQKDDLLKQLNSFKNSMDKYKVDVGLRTSRQNEIYTKLLARFFLLACKHRILKRENSLAKIRLTMMEHKNNTVLTRKLIRSVLLAKAKVAKRNCQILSIVGALQMTGPTTCSMIISRINTLLAASTGICPNSQDKLSQLKSSFMKHSLEKDQMIRALQTKLVSLDQLKENQEFLLEENRNLTEQIMIEQNNSQKLQQALNEQIERERLAFESESKSLYNRQYQLLMDNEHLSKENHNLKESLSSLLQCNPYDRSYAHDSTHVSNMDRASLIDLKYERVKNISNTGRAQESGLSLAPPYLTSPINYKHPNEFDQNLSFNNRDYRPRMVYHRV